MYKVQRFITLLDYYFFKFGFKGKQAVYGSRAAVCPCLVRGTWKALCLYMYESSIRGTYSSSGTLVK